MARPEPLFTKRMTVYTTNAATGQFSTVDRLNLPCRLVHVRGGDTAATRAELAQIRRLWFPADYEMPEHAQIEVDGIRWNVQPWTVGTIPGPAGAAFKIAELVRAG